VRARPSYPQIYGPRMAIVRSTCQDIGQCSLPPKFAKFGHELPLANHIDLHAGIYHFPTSSTFPTSKAGKVWTLVQTWTPQTLIVIMDVNALYVGPGLVWREKQGDTMTESSSTSHLPDLTEAQHSLIAAPSTFLICKYIVVRETRQTNINQLNTISYNTVLGLSCLDHNRIVALPVWNHQE